MSSSDEENKLNRSIRLCQLVCDRQIGEEIGYEIRKLLEEGVLIDFQDQSRNKKTALHLAVEKCDVICVKHLLQFKPNLEMKDEDGKTPVGLAESKGNRKILDIILNSTFDVVNESYIEVIDYKSLTRQKIEAIKLRPTFKVLKLINCPSVKTVLEKITHHDYATAFTESSHLFFIAIETNEANLDNDHDLVKKVLNLRRPMIVQLTSPSSQNQRIYFKEETKDFMEITDMPQITQEEFNKSVESECNMKLLVAALRSILFGHSTGNLLDTLLNTNKSRSEAVNRFARSNALCHRFLKLFDDCLPQVDRIVATSAFKGDQSLLALLDLPFEMKDETLKLTVYQQDILSVVDSSGCSLLMMAVEQSNLDAVKLLLRCGCDFNHSDNYDKRASDICWEKKSFDCLSELIEAGSPYPNNFRISEVDESSDAFKRINKMIEAIESFHESIEDGEIDEVKKFIASHAHNKHAYDTNNKCALTVALESDKIEIYSMLMSEGFEPGADDDEYQNACSESKFKSEIRNSHRKYFKEAFDEPHLKRLLKMFRLSFGSKDRAKCSMIIWKMFEKLNEIDEVIPILKICSLSDKLLIVFDFDCNSVVDMDPSKGSKSLGVYPSDGFIYIGAKNHETEFCKVIGNLIHELTHYAMILTYGNSCKPYDVSDIANTQLFENISIETKKICDDNPSTDGIVATAFNCYSGEVWHQQLIVRVPHLLAHYKMNPKARLSAEQNTPELFHFYREKTLKDVAKQSKVLLQKYLIGKINNQTGIARKIENLNVQFENLAIFWKPSVYVFTSNAPQLTLAMLYQLFQADSHIFVTLEQIELGNILDKIVKLNSKKNSASLIVDCIGHAQKYARSLRKLIENMKNSKTIALVMMKAESYKLKTSFAKLEFKIFTHRWDDLTESSKVHLLGQNVIFQGVEMKLNELVEPSSEAIKFFPLGELLDCRNLKIGNELPQTSYKFYIPRKFIKKGQERSSRVAANANSFEELSRDNPKMGAMIISDEAGSGKSVALFEIAKSLHVAFPDRWILFVDFKRHIKAFKGVEDHDKIESFEDFITQNILKNEPKFDRELFLQMFRDGKTSVLFDGFDEISPNYKDLLLHVLKLFEPQSGNHLFITTRPHLEADLEGALGKFVFTIEKFSNEDQTSMLREYWQSVGLEISHEDFEVLSRRLLKKFSDITRSKFIELPLLMRMTVEIFEDSTKENLLHKVDSLSIASVFRMFIEKYFVRWTNNENEISRNEAVEFHMARVILRVHHYIALTHFFVEKFISLDVDENDAEKISRVGLVRYDKTEKTFNFIHETFAEYFVADFICFHLNQKNRNPSHDCGMAIEVLIEISSESKQFDVVKTFLDQSLEVIEFSPSEAFCKSVAKYFSEEVKTKNCFDVLRETLVASEKNLANLFLSIVEYVEKEIFLKMLQSETRFASSVFLHVAAHGSKAVVSILLNLITTCTENPKEIFNLADHRFGNVLHHAVKNENNGVLTTLCASLNSVLRRDEIKIMFLQKDILGQNIIALASYNSNDVVFRELISMLPNYLSHDKTKSLLLAVDHTHQNLFHRAVTCNKLKVLNEATCELLSNDEIKSMLMQKDSDGSNVLHVIAEHGNVTVLNELNSLLRERLSDDEIRSLLMDLNEKGENCFRLAANSTKINLQIFCETIGNLMPIDDQMRLLQQSIQEIDIIRLACGNYNTREIVPLETIKYLLTKEDEEERIAFQTVAKHGEVDTWHKLISFTKARFSKDELKSFLFYCDENGQNCLQITVSECENKNMIETIFETIKTLLSVEDQKKFARQKDFKNKNVFHHAAASSDEAKCFSLYDGLSTILSKDDIKEMLKEKDSDGNNILICSIENSPVFDGVSRRLMSFLQATLTNDEIEELLLDVIREGRNFFHYTVEFSSKFEIKFSSKAIKKILDRDDQKKFFGTKNPNVFHLAVRNPHSGVFSTLHECLKEVLTENENKSLIQEINSENKNILHLLCEQNANHDASRSNIDNEKRLHDFLKFLKDVCDADELKKILTSSDHTGSTCLLLAAQFEDQIFLKELFSFIRSELIIDDQRNLVQKSDNKNKNIFTYYNKVAESTMKKQNINFLQSATDSNKFLSTAQSKYETLIEFTCELLSKDEIKSMLMQKDSDGSNVLHVIAEHGNATVLNELNSLLRERLSDDEIRSLLMDLNQKGENCFRLAANSTKINLQIFCETIGNLISIDDQNRLLQESAREINIISLASENYKTKEVLPLEIIKYLLKIEDQEGRNAFRRVAHRGNADTWNKLVSFTHARFSMEMSFVFESFLFDCDKNGQNCLHLAVSGTSRGNMIEAICKTIKTVGLSVKDQKMLVKRKDSAGRNVFHCAAQSNSAASKCFLLFDCLSTILSLHEIKEMLKEKDSNGGNVLICSIGSSPAFDEVSHAIFQFLQATLTNDEIKELLLDVDCAGKNFFHYTVEFSSKAEIKSACKAIKKFLSRYDQRKFFGTKNPNVFHLAMKNRHSGVFSALNECLKEVLTANENKSLIQEINSENKHILHLLCEHDSKKEYDDDSKYDNIKSLRDFLKVLKDVYDADELNKFLTSLDINGSNCLLLAAQFRDEPFLKELLSFSRSELAVDDQRKLIQKRDKDGKNIFTCAFLNKVAEILSFVEDFTKEILSEGQIQEMKKNLRQYTDTKKVTSPENEKEKQARLSNQGDKSVLATQSKPDPKDSLQSVDADGWSELHHASKFANSQDFTQLCIKLKLYLTKDELKSMFRMKTSWFQFTPVMLVATNRNADTFTNFWEFIESNFDDETRRNILLQKDINKNTILHFAIRSQNKISFQLAMGMLKNTLEIDQIRSLVLSNNDFNESIWFGPCSTEMYREATKTVWSCMPKIFDIDVLKQILIDVLPDERTPFLIKSIILFHSDGILGLVLNHFDEEERKQINLWRSIIEEAQHCSIEFIKYLFENIPLESRNIATTSTKYPLLHNTIYCQPSLPYFRPTALNNIKQIFLERDEKSQTIFHFAVLNKDPEVLKSLVSKAKVLLNLKDLREVLLAVDDKRRNIMLCSLRNSNKNTLEATVEIIKENLPDDFETMLCDYDAFGQTILHYACSIREYIADKKEPKPQIAVEIVSNLFKKANLSRHKLKDFLLHKDQKGKSALYYATFVDFKFLRDEMFLADGLLSEEEFGSFLAIDNQRL